MTKTGVYPGTFDPITNGHLDVIKRALKIFDELIVAVAMSSYKKTPIFTVEERVHFIAQTTKDLKNLKVEVFDGLLVNFIKEKKAVAIVRGLRAVSDYEFELQLAHANRRLFRDIETVFLMPSEEYSFLSSSLVKEIAYFGGSVKSLVPPIVEKALRNKFKK
ncbi:MULTISPECIES: pantetheine-phosphate adenylyltransferase [Thermodesulfovibrio]|jgi:pantetheine-phosphate adenylyltransferase|uniref:Phosphopantetheine adenylyltransferase n=1 Tax=Thermodesulfovibrio yellowstonii (strain ATCC 51303 / DSM 11347 / YP87) TaxID=289376 RepID=COAD_THEYD|nr:MULTISPECIES: pantetheine-phosphate adenylyltransferase [Thermodesulfovibrio]B5YK79.1 RecName: Full=Phosphopantetheine adenylyltransferase; AltName: Full=Dephospho-CoA pyrophosphorylase; AltName: Full=Pantetheine-phosphate adenylyltransferase; Short=PPAT [Thermodesulfovibrio yellowstonii DSM 11347]ACI20782.1 pantetheine-phosphate adenylyltransferase [Thermodesulfovibrio yellowstonii DSM 11347]MBC7190202.1 pantetheine-phosphate adenylyltransferase [Candidatus Aerophobetes bacterium]MDI6865315